MAKEPSPEDVEALEKEQREIELQAEFDEFEAKEAERLNKQKMDDELIAEKEAKRLEKKESLRKELHTEYDTMVSEKAEVKKKQAAEDKRKYDELYKPEAPAKKMDKYTGNPVVDKFLNKGVDFVLGGSGGGGRSKTSGKGSSTSSKRKSTKGKGGFSSGISLSSMNMPSLGKPVTGPVRQAQPKAAYGSGIPSLGKGRSIGAPQFGSGGVSVGFPIFSVGVPKSKLTSSVKPTVSKQAPKETFSLNMGSIWGKKKTNPLKGGKKTLW